MNTFIWGAIVGWLANSLWSHMIKPVIKTARQKTPEGGYTLTTNVLPATWSNEDQK